MLLKYMINSALALLTLTLPVASTNTCNDTTTVAACDSTCLHRLTYLTAYSSASNGVKLAMDAYDAYDSCINDNVDWCPEMINTTISGIVGNAIQSVAIDFNNCSGGDCILASLANVSRISALWAMQWAHTFFNTGEGYSEHGMCVLNQTVWELSQEEPVEIDECVLINAIDSTNDTQSDPTISHESNDDDDPNHINKDLAIGLPFLGVPLTLLAPFAIDKGLCTIDPVLCYGPTLTGLRRLFKGAKNVLPRTNWFRSLFEGKSFSNPLKGRFPRDPFSKIPNPFTKGSPVKPGELLRAERYNPDNGRLEQQTLRSISEEVAKESRIHKVNDLADKGLRPYQVLDSEGNIIKKEIEHPKSPNSGKTLPRISWQRPEDLEPVEGQWRRIGQRFVRMDNGAPAIDSMGQPVVASEAGPLLTLEPVVPTVTFDDTPRYKMFDPEDALEEGDAGAEEATVAFDPATGSVDFSDTPNDNGDDNGSDDSGNTMYPGELEEKFPFEDDESDSSNDPGSEDKDPDDPNDDDPDAAPTSVYSTYLPEETQYRSPEDQHHDEPGSDENPEDPNDDDPAAKPTSAFSTTLPRETRPPTTFSTMAKSETATASSNPGKATVEKTPYEIETNSSSRANLTWGTPSGIGHLPEFCIGNGTVLHKLGHTARKSGDEVIEHLSREDQYSWVKTVFPPQCQPAERGEHMDMSLCAQTECYLIISKLSKKERRAWVAGMLPPDCPYDEKDFDLDKDREKECKHIKGRLHTTAFPGWRKPFIWYDSIAEQDCRLGKWSA